jgi:predicted  nucleic acid-binding Zn-ribbon protein
MKKTDSEKLDDLTELVSDMVATFGKRFDGVDERFETIDHRFVGINRRFDIIDQRFDATDRRFDTIEAQLRDLSWEVRDINKRLTIIEESVAGMKGYAKEIDDLAARIRAIEKHLGIDRALLA